MAKNKERAVLPKKGEPDGKSGREHRDSLILESQGFVHQVVGRLVNSLNLPPAHTDEFVAAGYLGLVEAAERFDRFQGSDFKKYSYLRIRGSIIDSIRKSSELSGRAYHLAKTLKAVQELRETLLEQELALKNSKGEWLNTTDDLDSILDYLAQGTLAYRLSAKEMEMEFETIPDSKGYPGRRIEKIQDRLLLRKVVNSLPENERSVIEQYYFQGKSFTDIVNEKKCGSKSWVSRLHARALNRLKERYCEALSN